MGNKRDGAVRLREVVRRRAACDLLLLDHGAESFGPGFLHQNLVLYCSVVRHDEAPKAKPAIPFGIVPNIYELPSRRERDRGVEATVEVVHPDRTLRPWRALAYRIAVVPSVTAVSDPQSILRTEGDAAGAVQLPWSLAFTTDGAPEHAASIEAVELSGERPRTLI